MSQPAHSIVFERSVLFDLVSLGKPRIVSLQLIATGCAMLVASGGSVSVAVFVATMVGGALVSGSAGAVNHIYDIDIDAVMSRTKDRPLPAGRLPVSAAWAFAVVTGVAGFWILFEKVNPLAAYLALSGHLFYVFVYTVWLKRRTPQNIVIGGAAGGVPPMVGWVAVQGHLSWSAVLMFLLTVLWTPPHFWALALNKDTDYRKAGIPMLPVVAGARSTARQMYWYALGLVPAGVAMAFSDPMLGWFTAVSSAFLGAIFTHKIVVLRRLIDAESQGATAQAWGVFGFSIVYLALVFVALVVDAALIL